MAVLGGSAVSYERGDPVQSVWGKRSISPHGGKGVVLYLNKHDRYTPSVLSRRLWQPKSTPKDVLRERKRARESERASERERARESETESEKERQRARESERGRESERSSERERRGGREPGRGRGGKREAHRPPGPRPPCPCPTSHQRGSQSSFANALTCTTNRQITASASTNHEIEKDNFIPR